MNQINKGFDGGIPSSKDEVAHALLLQVITNLDSKVTYYIDKQDQTQKELQSTKDLLKDEVNRLTLLINDLKSNISSIDTKEVNESVQYTKTARNINSILLPVVFLLVIGFAILGFKEYVRHDNVQVPLNQIPNSQFILPENFNRGRNDLESSGDLNRG